jgi:hypothetical protein
MLEEGRSNQGNQTTTGVKENLKEINYSIGGIFKIYFIKISLLKTHLFRMLNRKLMNFSPKISS